MTYSNLRTGDRGGSTLADYLVGIEADLLVSDDTRVIFEEPRFPVCELARGLRAWANGEPRTDFVFDSMSFEEPGSLIIEHRSSGWVVRSAFEPGVESSVVSLNKVDQCVEGFVASLSNELARVGIDPEWLLAGS